MVLVMKTHRLTFFIFNAQRCFLIISLLILNFSFKKLRLG